MHDATTTSATQTEDRPTRAAVALTLAMMMAPLFTLLVSAAGCTRPATRTTAVDVQEESPAPRLDATSRHAGGASASK